MRSVSCSKYKWRNKQSRRRERFQLSSKVDEDEPRWGREGKRSTHAQSGL